MNKDLTEGRVAPILIKFALPLLLSMVFQQLYNIADSLVAGKFISEEALAAVGNSYEITLIFIAFAFGCNMGTSILVSQFFGAKRYDDVRLAITTSYISTFVLVVTHLRRSLQTVLYISISIYTAWFSSSSIILQQESSPPLATAGLRLSSLPSPQQRTFSWIYSL